MKKLNVAIIGAKFMGKAHSSAWSRVHRFFDVPIEPVLKVACGHPDEPLQSFADRWGWESISTDWKETVNRPDVDIVDIAAPTFLHHDVAIEAAKAGKHVFCEKPLCLTYRQAVEMCEAAEKAGIVHYLNHNYRRCPAVSLARRLIDEGRLGRIFHWRSAYLQSWIVDPEFPLTWHLRKETAGSGPHGDLNSHLVDLARFLVGDITEVTAMTAQFIKERPLPNEGSSGAFQAGQQVGSRGKGPVTVEDAAFMLARFENGALGSFEATRFAPGRKNYNSFEIYGSKGSLEFNVERMNELNFFSADDPDSAQGFRNILVTEPIHPYLNAWWPPGHIIGYEHTFVNAMADFLNAIGSGTRVEPSFVDGVKEMAILDAGLESARTGRVVEVARK
ncbi:MAG: Gfo/Idh/MocA family oxidoreductase [Candidatus Solibacter sp.]|nr:Gfo/Idh/MocA family oxidoreductase [Candidatus Solibacter sp.]